MKTADVIRSLEKRLADRLPANVSREDLARFSERFHRACSEWDPLLTPLCKELERMVWDRVELLEKAAEAARMDLPQLAARFVEYGDWLSTAGHRLDGDDAFAAFWRWLDDRSEQVQVGAWFALNHALQGRQSDRFGGAEEMFLRRMRADEAARMFAAVAEQARSGAANTGRAIRDFLAAYLLHGRPDPVREDELYAFERDGKYLLLIEPEVKALARLRVGAAAFEAAHADPMPGADLMADTLNVAAQQLAGKYVGVASQLPELDRVAPDKFLEDERSRRRLRHARQAAELRRPTRGVLVVAWVTLEGGRLDNWMRRIEEAHPVGKAVQWSRDPRAADEAQAEAHLATIEKVFGEVLHLPDTPDVLDKARDEIVERYKAAEAAAAATRAEATKRTRAEARRQRRGARG